LQSSHPFDAPLIDPGFLRDDEDLATLCRGVRQVSNILERPALEPLRGANLFGERGLDGEALAQLVRNRADTIYHPAGSCRMGRDEMAVVDAELRVHG